MLTSLRMPRLDKELERLICEVREARCRLEETLRRSERLTLSVEALQARCDSARQRAAAVAETGSNQSWRVNH